MGTSTGKKLLYLDFDGVLHDAGVFFRSSGEIFMGPAGRSLFEWMPILENLLTPHSDVAIVLSTKWVQVRSFQFAKSQLSARLQERVIGATYHRRGMRKDEFNFLSRGEQIASDASRRQPKVWFALDDDDEGWPAWCREKLIKTEGTRGISSDEVQEAIRLRLQHG